jgi:hypothetical protein
MGNAWWSNRPEWTGIHKPEAPAKVFPNSGRSFAGASGLWSINLAMEGGRDTSILQAFS